MSSTELSTVRTNVKTPRAKRVGRTARANRSKASFDTCAMKPSAIRVLDTETHVERGPRGALADGRRARALQAEVLRREHREQRLAIDLGHGDVLRRPPWRPCTPTRPPAGLGSGNAGPCRGARSRHADHAAASSPRVGPGTPGAAPDHACPPRGASLR